MAVSVELTERQIEATANGLSGWQRMDFIAQQMRAAPPQSVVFENGFSSNGHDVFVANGHTEIADLIDMSEWVRGIGELKRNGTNAATVKLLETPEELGNLVDDLARRLAKNDRTKRDDVAAYINYLGRAERDEQGRIKGVRPMRLPIKGKTLISINGSEYNLQHLIPEDCRGPLGLIHRKGTSRDRVMFIFYVDKNGREIAAIDNSYTHSQANHVFSTKVY